MPRKPRKPSVRGLQRRTAKPDFGQEQLKPSRAVKDGKIATVRPDPVHGTSKGVLAHVRRDPRFTDDGDVASRAAADMRSTDRLDPSTTASIT